MEQKKLFCGICESSCGLVATVQDGKLLNLRPDREHPNSQGFACSKGIGFAQVPQDPDRVLHPLKRQLDGTFERVSWEAALDDISTRLRAVIKEHGKQSLGVYFGNPLAWNYGAALWIQSMAAALKTKHMYSAGSVDIYNYWVVGHLLYGDTLINPFPDLHRTDFFLVLGANPVLSHGSMMTVGQVRETMLAVTERGGRVVVVDPRRTETAELFEHVPIRPGADAWLVAAMLKVVLDEGLADLERLRNQTTGWEALAALVSEVDLSRAELETGIDGQTIAGLARDFARAPSAALYGRCGASLGRFATLTKYLIDAFNIATGNLDRPGGYVFGRGMGEFERLGRLAGLTGYARWRTRVDGFPEVNGQSPLISLPREIETPGPGQLRALLVCSGNFRNTGPAGHDVDRALAKLDLLVSLDLYITDTSRHADYILPPTTWLERDGFPGFTSGHSAVPYAQWSRATLAAPGETRDDWWIIAEICRRIGVVPSPFALVRFLGKLGLRLSPATTMDLALRLSRDGDLFGLRRKGLSRRKLQAHGGGVKLADGPETGGLKHHIVHRDRRVHLDHPVIHQEMAALLRHDSVDTDYPLSLISLRELRGQNSWLHNVPKLMAGDRVQRLRIHPEDARTCGVEHGDQVDVTSRYGSITVEAMVSAEVMPGVVALPQGWGNTGGWRRAVAAGGATYNELASNDPRDADQPSGQAILNGIGVRVRSKVGAVL